MKRYLTILMTTLLLAGTAKAEHKFNETEAASWIDKVSALIKEYQTDTAQGTTSGAQQFVRTVANYDYVIQDIKRNLYYGFDRCLPSIKQARRDFKELKRQFDSYYASEPLVAFRLGWNRLQVANLEMDWALTSGRREADQ